MNFTPACSNNPLDSLGNAIIKAASVLILKNRLKSELTNRSESKAPLNQLKSFLRSDGALH